MPVYLDRLARFVSDIRLEHLESSTVDAAKLVVLDTIGAMLAGSRLPENKKLARLVVKIGGQGSATLLGHTDSATAVFATLSNATAGVALEMDEGNRLGGGHAAIHVIPAALAVAEERGSSGVWKGLLYVTYIRADLGFRVLWLPISYFVDSLILRMDHQISITSCWVNPLTQKQWFIIWVHRGIIGYSRTILSSMPAAFITTRYWTVSSRCWVRRVSFPTTSIQLE